MGTKLHIGNLAYSVTAEALGELFAQFGSVQSSKVITDRDTGHSKGFAFIEMGSESEAEACISATNGRDFEGRSLKVSIAKPMEPRTGGGFNRRPRQNSNWR